MTNKQRDDLTQALQQVSRRTMALWPVEEPSRPPEPKFEEEDYVVEARP